jgi:Spy/CpxP family protein refolding chaperone
MQPDAGEKRFNWTPCMKKQFLILGVAVLAGALAGGVLIFALRSNRPIPTRNDSALEAPHDRSMAGEAKSYPPPGPPKRQPDPLAPDLFPPELVMKFQDQIGLRNEQRQAIMDDLQKAQPKFEQIQQQMRKEQAALVLLLAKERAELEPSLAQAEKVHDLEREMKRTHLAILIGIKNRLTAEQQAQLREIQAQQSPAEDNGANAPRSIQEKMQRLQTGIQQWQQSGQDPSPIKQAMQPFQALMGAGQFKEAEAVLDEALKMLAEGKPPR